MIKNHEQSNSGTVYFLLLAFLAISMVTPTRADEGMWPMDRVPRHYLQEQYGFTPDDAWIEHIQKSCIRFAGSGSASFVSPGGLVMTNHHVGSGAIRSVSSAEHDYIKDGFLAASAAEEIKCPNLQAEVLMAIRDVTDETNAAVSEGMPPETARRARTQRMDELAVAWGEERGLHAETVILFGGARRYVYLYKQYDDVRLVMAPEAGIAFLGGDNANFEYPRYNLDVSFFRVYENDQPLKVEHYLRWSSEGAGEGDLVLMAGHPYRTQRLATVDHLRFVRDIEIPCKLAAYNLREVSLLQFMARGSEQRRVGSGPLLRIQNGRKAYDGRLAGLYDIETIEDKLESQERMKAFVRKNPDLQSTYGAPWRDVAGVLGDAASYWFTYYLLEQMRQPFGDLFDVTKKLVRLETERTLPDIDRLPEYRKSEWDSLSREIASSAPLNLELEQVRLRDGLLTLARVLTGDNSVTAAALLGGKAPDVRAAEIMARTKLADPQFRLSLIGKGRPGLMMANDPLIKLVIRLDKSARAARKQYEDKFEARLQDAYSRIANIAFEAEADGVYPDATGTLRLSIGTVASYEEGSTSIPAMTTLGGAYQSSEHHASIEAWNLPERWVRAEEKIDKSVPFNFASTNDIIGGNSGSPAFNRQGEVVGIVFDGNIHGLVWDYQFTQQLGRAVSVDARGIIEALREVYDADRLVSELLATQN